MRGDVAGLVEGAGPRRIKPRPRWMALCRCAAGDALDVGPLSGRRPEPPDARRVGRGGRAPRIRHLPPLPEPTDPRRADAAGQHDRECPVQDGPLPRPARRRGPCRDRGRIRRASRAGRPRQGADRSAPPTGEAGRRQDGAARHVDARRVRGIRRRTVRGVGVRGRGRRRRRATRGPTCASIARGCAGSSNASTARARPSSARPSCRSSSARSTIPVATRASS